MDEAIEVIKSSGIKCDVGPFATIVEGKYDEVTNVINKINEHLQKRNCSEWITNVQIQIRSNDDNTSDEKTAKHQ